MTGIAMRGAGASHLLLVAGLLLTGSPAAAQSCPCPPYDLAAIVQQSEVIAVGKVLSATTDSIAPMQSKDGTWWNGAEYQTRLTLDVSTVLKGNPPRFVEVVTPTGPCGFIFFVGKTYLVAGVGQGATITTDVCHGNATGTAMDFRLTLVRDLLHPEP